MKSWDNCEGLELTWAPCKTLNTTVTLCLMLISLRTYTSNSGGVVWICSIAFSCSLRLSSCCLSSSCAILLEITYTYDWLFRHALVSLFLEFTWWFELVRPIGQPQVWINLSDHQPMCRVLDYHINFRYFRQSMLRCSRNLDPYSRVMFKCEYSPIKYALRLGFWWRNVDAPNTVL